MKKALLRTRFKGRRKKKKVALRKADLVAQVKRERREGASRDMVAILEENKELAQFEKDTLHSCKTIEG